jgi:hypothetical protein
MNCGANGVVSGSDHMTTSIWRQRANKVIAESLKETEGQPIKDRIKAIRDAYPFGPREMHPYKIWLSAVKIARAELEGNPIQPKVGHRFQKKEHVEVEGQQSLFGEKDG